MPTLTVDPVHEYQSPVYIDRLVALYSIDRMPVPTEEYRLKHANITAHADVCILKNVFLSEVLASTLQAEHRFQT